MNAVKSGYLLHNGLLAPLFLIAIFAMALDSSWLARVFSTGTALILGNMSFAIYILQGPWKVTFLTALSRLGFRPMPEFWFPYLITLLAVSLMAVVLVEGPLDRLLLRRISPKRTVEAP